MAKCMVTGCEEEAQARGRCNRHYLKWWRETPPSERGATEKRPPKRHVELVSLFGGIRPFCRAVGIDPVTLYRWPDGAIPPERWGEISDGAARAGVSVEAVRAVLVK